MTKPPSQPQKKPLSQGTPTRPQTQVEKFQKLAQEMGCELDDAKFEKTLKRIAQHRPKKS